MIPKQNLGSPLTLIFTYNLLFQQTIANKIWYTSRFSPSSRKLWIIPIVLVASFVCVLSVLEARILISVKNASGY